MIRRRVREGRPAEVGDVFGCFDRLGASIVAYLLFLAFALVVLVILVGGFEFYQSQRRRLMRSAEEERATLKGWGLA